MAHTDQLACPICCRPVETLPTLLRHTLKHLHPRILRHPLD